MPPPRTHYWQKAAHPAGNAPSLPQIHIHRRVLPIGEGGSSGSVLTAHPDSLAVAGVLLCGSHCFPMRLPGCKVPSVSFGSHTHRFAFILPHMPYHQLASVRQNIYEVGTDPHQDFRPAVFRTGRVVMFPLHVDFPISVRLQPFVAAYVKSASWKGQQAFPFFLK